MLPESISRVTVRETGVAGHRTWAHRVSSFPPRTCELTVTAKNLHGQRRNIKKSFLGTRPLHKKLVFLSEIGAEEEQTPVTLGDSQLHTD